MAQRTQSSRGEPNKVKVGAEIDLGKPGYVRLPDGSVVSTSRTYTIAHPGEHRADGITVVAEAEFVPDKAVS